MRICGIALLALAASGCVSQAEQQAGMEALNQQLSSLDTKLAATQASVGALSAAEETSRQQMTDQITELRAEVDALPEQVASLCPQDPQVTAPICEEQAPVRTVVTTGDKMLVGELERVWIDPPGNSLVARIDTGAKLSLLRTESLVAFERDGDDWVRFELLIDKELTTIERQVKRHVKTRQKDSSSTRRPVVDLRVRIGDIQDTFEFTLSGSSDLDHQIVLGRNFLKDIALVDVSKRFVQPPYRPAAD